MIREERDPAFWADIASHSAVRDTLFGLEPAHLGHLATRPDMLPLASANGGFLFARTTWGCFELHTLYKPAGWGREVHDAGKEALAIVFLHGALITTYQISRASQPPRSFGFECIGPVASPFGEVVLWTLSKARWEASPAGRRRTCPQPC